MKLNEGNQLRIVDVPICEMWDRETALFCKARESGCILSDITVLHSSICNEHDIDIDSSDKLREDVVVVKCSDVGSIVLPFRAK